MIINNLTRNNHLKALNALFLKATEITIISPFITKNTDLIDFKSFSNLKKINFITTLKPYDKDQYSKISYYFQLYKKLSEKNIEINISIDNTLHGKIFVAKYANNEQKAILTSANFTDHGLRVNNEWGILIHDETQIESLLQSIENNIKFEVINDKVINNYIDEINKNPKPSNPINPVTLDLTTLLINKVNFHKIKSNANFWLKPIGVTENPISLSEIFDDIDLDLHFSKTKPSGVKIGDIIISYAVKHLNIISIYKVKSGINYTGNSDDRWPYFVVGENLTPNYGREWSKHNITISNQKNKVISKKLFNITPSGKNSYGSLMQGADKLKITSEFGNYLLNLISDLDYSLKKL